jgi:hypothetical protein
MADALEAFAKKLEQMPGPSREVDADIAKLRGANQFWRDDDGVNWVVMPTTGRKEVLPSYTSSLGAAATLVPRQHPEWNIHPRATGLCVAIVGRSQMFYGMSTSGVQAIALCAAALRAWTTVNE